MILCKLDDLSALKAIKYRTVFVLYHEPTKAAFWGASADVFTRLGQLVSYIRHPATLTNATLRRHIEATGQKLEDWRGIALEQGDTRDSLPPILISLNKPAGRPAKNDGTAGLPSVIRAFGVIVRQTTSPQVYDLDAALARTPPDLRPAFAWPATVPLDFALANQFAVCLYYAMKHDRNYNPSPEAIAGLWAWHAARHSITAAPPRTLHEALAVPCPPSCARIDWKTWRA